MTLSELRTFQTELLSYDLDNVSGEDPTKEQQDAQLNRAMRAISKEIFIFDPQVSLKLTKDKLRYNLDDRKIVGKRVVRPYYVTVDGNKLRDAGGVDYGVWGFKEFVHEHPTWESASSGAPTKAVVYGAREVIVHLPPTAAIAGKLTNYIGGQVLANDLVEDSDDPSSEGIPVEIHEGIAILASIFAATPTVSAQEGLIRLAAQDKEWKALVNTVKSENRNLFHVGTRTDTPYRDVIDF